MVHVLLAYTTAMYGKYLHFEDKSPLMVRPAGWLAALRRKEAARQEGPGRHHHHHHCYYYYTTTHCYVVVGVGRG